MPSPNTTAEPFPTFKQAAAAFNLPYRVQREAHAGLIPVYKFGKDQQLVTLRQAATLLGLHYWQLQRAARAGLIPTYTFYNKRKLVRPSEVMAVIEASRVGGQK